MTGKFCMVGKFWQWEEENGQKKFLYYGKFPSGGDKHLPVHENFSTEAPTI
jgi:hypothetical protein